MRPARRRFRILAGAFLPAAFVALAAASNPRPAAPSERMANTRSQVPDRAVIEWSSESRAGRTRLSLFSNRFAILKTVDARGGESVEHRILSAEELAVYEKFVTDLFPKTGPSGVSATREGDGHLVSTVRMTSLSGRSWSWTWDELGEAPLSAAAIATAASQLAGTVREKRKIDDPWKDAPPVVGERLVRFDGIVFVVTGIDSAQDLVELEAIGQPLRSRTPRAELHSHFLLERDEVAIGGQSAATAPAR